MSEIIPPKNLYNTTYNDILTEVESFDVLPESDPLIVVDDSCEVMFSNNSFKKTFRLNNEQDFFNLTTEPDLKALVKNLSSRNYTNFQIDLTISSENDFDGNLFNLELERLTLENKKYNTIKLKSLKENSRFEERINNLHFALEYGKVPVIFIDKDGIIKYSTAFFEDILKFNIEELFNKSISEVLFEFLTYKEKDRFDKAILDKKEWSKTISRKLVNGNVEYYDLKLLPIYKGVDDKPSFLLTANDITDYVLKNLFVKKSEKRLKSIINNITDLLLIFQKKGNEYLFENANDNFCKSFSIDKNKVLRKNLNLFLDKSFFLQLQLSIQEFYTSKSMIVEFNYRSKQNRTFSAKITFIGPKSFDNTLYILSMEDITDQVLYREQLEIAYKKEINLNKLKTAFLENMSHEIRTPFNAILGYSDIIDDCIKDKDYETILELMSSFKDVLNRVLKLFNNIDEVFQITSGELELDFVTLNINQVLKAVYNKRIQEVTSKNLDFKLELYKNDLCIDTDWVKFEKIINSLIDNAIKYTNEGRIKLISRFLNDKAEIVISDTGKGIKTENMKKLFEPFVQEEEAYIRNYEGAGLGLTIAYKLTQLMGGEFNIISKENNGTEIILSFPSSLNSN